MLAKRKKPKLKETPRTDFPRHRKFVRQHVCIVPNCISNYDASLSIEACHVRKGLPATTPIWAWGGTSKKPHDAFVFPACSHHHREQHSVGETTFAKTYGINPLREALDLARHSPVDEVRQFVKELGL